MDWAKIFSKSIGSSIILTIIFPIVQIILNYIGISWFAPLPRPEDHIGVSFWGVPWGFISRVVYPNAPYVVEWNFLIYNLIFWFIIFFMYYSYRFRKRKKN